jgi:hypothetical protein
VTLMRGFELHGLMRRWQTATPFIVPIVERERRRARLSSASPFPLVDLASRRVLDAQHGDPDTPPFAEEARRKILVIVEAIRGLWKSTRLKRNAQPLASSRGRLRPRRRTESNLSGDELANCGS